MKGKKRTIEEKNQILQSSLGPMLQGKTISKVSVWVIDAGADRDADGKEFYRDTDRRSIQLNFTDGTCMTLDWDAALKFRFGVTDAAGTTTTPTGQVLDADRRVNENQLIIQVGPTIGKIMKDSANA